MVASWRFISALPSSSTIRFNRERSAKSWRNAMVNDLSYGVLPAFQRGHSRPFIAEDAGRPDAVEPRTTRDLLLSIRPGFAAAILQGRKRIELRRRKPRSSLGSLVFLYASSPVKAVVGAFLASGVTSFPVSWHWQTQGNRAAVTEEEYRRYFEGASTGYALVAGACWELVNPFPLSLLRTLYPGFWPPQSFRYLRQNNAEEARIASALRSYLRRVW